ncbi:MAG TPA: hypothetical protein DCR40_18815 [Prolixibacteraceae bacterium]|nr:hypothetical protein [Prolixibacteraceae bacterium]
MKSSSFTILIWTVWFTVTVLTGSAQPNWELNPQDYEYSMTITGKVTTDGYFSVNENDLVAAFVGGKCRGITNLRHEMYIDECFAYLMVYSNAPMEKITFKIFNSSENLVVSTNDTISFTINQIVGSLDVPYIFSSNLLNSEAKLLSFTIPDQVGETIIENNNVFLRSSSGSALTGISPGFSTSAGAKVFVNGVKQVSDKTINDFVAPVQYMIVSADFSDTVIYSVQIKFKENNSPSAINLSNKLIGESAEINSIVATLTTEDLDVGDTHKFSLIKGNGTNDSENSLFLISGNSLILSKTLNFEDKQILNILIRVTDSQGAVYVQNFGIKVTNTNVPPRFSSSPVKYVLQNEIFVYPILVSDNDGDTINLSIENLPKWLTYNPNSKLISGVAGNDDVGDYSFKIKASDSEMESVQMVVFSVINVNDPPEINYFIENQFFSSNRENEIRLPVDCITDPDEGDILTFLLSTENNSALPYWLNFDLKTFVISGKPPQGTEENINLKLTATDKGKLKEWIVFKLAVSIPTAVNDREDNQIFRCFPNPVKDKLQINIPQGNQKAHISIGNMEGQIIRNMVLSAGSQTDIPFEGATGVYFIYLRQGEHKQIEKIIKQ